MKHGINIKIIDLKRNTAIEIKINPHITIHNIV